MNPQLLVFIPLALVAIATAIGMLISRSAIYSALHLIINFASIAMLYLLLGAPFIALAQITVYAGAIMVLFLFVIMLLGVDQLRTATTLRWQQPVAVGMGILLLIISFALIFFGDHVLPQTPTNPAADFGSPRLLAEILYTNYLLPFEVTSILLLVAMIGAIVLSRRLGPRGKQAIALQSAAQAAVQESAKEPTSDPVNPPEQAAQEGDTHASG